MQRWKCIKRKRISETRFPVAQLMGAIWRAVARAFQCRHSNDQVLVTARTAQLTRDVGNHRAKVIN